MINVGIYGATGYAGYELLHLLKHHRAARVVFAASETQAGKALADVFPGPLDAPLLSFDDAPLGDVDVVFLALPHGVAGPVARQVRAAGVRVVDLSADFRFPSTAEYTRWYGNPPPVPELLPAPYGLPEFYRAAVQDAMVVANPGCYPTSVLLGLAPLLRAGALADPLVIVDSKSGTSGAGRSAKVESHFVEVNESVSPYNIGKTHRHVGEMQQELGRLWDQGAPDVVFSPHLLPLDRGILSTVYVHIHPEWNEQRIRSLYAEMYAGEPFVRLLPAGQLAKIVHTSRTNMCAISLTLVRPGMLIVVSSIDNLGKGAAGQAVQNMNVMFGIEETEGLL
jgi:N-acetyl-gamma-glutamyl-phosphate reductase